MCKLKSEGDRCAYHQLVNHPAAQYAARVTGWITGASKKEISAEMTKMNKEARDMPQVSAGEATDYLNRELFVTENDATLPAHEKKIRRNQLLRALGEVRNGVIGSHFHVWKNLLGRVRSRVARTVAVAGLSGMLALGMSACSAGVPTNPSNSPTVTQSQGASPAPSASAPVDTSAVKGGAALGSGTKVTDARGTYETLAVDPNAASLKYDSKIVDAGATERFSKAEILSAQKFATDFLVTQTFDSTAYDNGKSGWDEWKAKNADKYVVAGSDVLNDTKSGKYSAVILTDKGEANPVAIRDGKTRQSEVTVDLTKVAGYDYKGKTYISVSGVGTAKYRATDESMIKGILAANPDKTKEDLITLIPSLGDGKGENSYPVAFTFGYALQQQADGSWKIAGYSNEYHNTLFDQ